MKAFGKEIHQKAGPVTEDVLEDLSAQLTALKDRAADAILEQHLEAHRVGRVVKLGLLALILTLIGSLTFLFRTRDPKSELMPTDSTTVVHESLAANPREPVIARGAGAVDDGGGAAGVVGNYAGGVTGSPASSAVSMVDPVRDREREANRTADILEASRIKVPLRTQTETFVATMESRGWAGSTGGLSSEQIIDVMSRDEDLLLACFRRFEFEEFELSGDMIIEFTVNPAGRISLAEVTVSPSRRTQMDSRSESEMRSCLLTRLELLRFPSPDKGWTARVSYPVRFRVRKL